MFSALATNNLTLFFANQLHKTIALSMGKEKTLKIFFFLSTLINFHAALPLETFV